MADDHHDHHAPFLGPQDQRTFKYLSRRLLRDLGDRWVYTSWQNLFSSLLAFLLSLFVCFVEVAGERLKELLNNHCNGKYVTIGPIDYQGDVLGPGQRVPRSVVGHIDWRMDLESNTKKRFPLLSTMTRANGDMCAMAAKLAYEHPLLVQDVVENQWNKGNTEGRFRFADSLIKRSNHETPASSFNDNAERSAAMADTKVYLFTRDCSPAHPPCNGYTDAAVVAFCHLDWMTDFNFQLVEIDGIGSVYKSFLEALGIRMGDDCKYLDEFTRYIKAAYDRQEGLLAGQPVDGESQSGSDEAYLKEMRERLIARDGEGKIVGPLYFVLREKVLHLLHNNSDIKLFVTGHSLGGALAALFTSLLVVDSPLAAKKLKALTTFGQPCVGNLTFLWYLHNRVNNPELRYVRVLHCNDIVPHIPFDNACTGPCFHSSASYHIKMGAFNDRPKLGFFRAFAAGMIQFLYALYRNCVDGNFRESFLSLIIRFAGILLPWIADHSPTNYINVIRLGLPLDEASQEAAARKQASGSASQQAPASQWSASKQAIQQAVASKQASGSASQQAAASKQASGLASQQAAASQRSASQQARQQAAATQQVSRSASQQAAASQLSASKQASQQVAASKQASGSASQQARQQASMHIALEKALETAPSAALMVSESIHRDDSDTVDGSGDGSGNGRGCEQSLVVGRPILLALEDIDGSPSFLEKALRYLEKQHGTLAEGLLRLSANVEEVDRRIREYECGKDLAIDGFEDPHVIGDCVKYVLRELPSSPVPTPCCNALVDAYRLDGPMDVRLAAMQRVVYEAFPEPNRRLVARVLRMMRTIARTSEVNLMRASSVAACMAPLLLRPLLSGECGLDDDSGYYSADASTSLIAAAAAANLASSIVLMLMEEYDMIFVAEDRVRYSRPSPSIYGGERSGRVKGQWSDDDENALVRRGRHMSFDVDSEGRQSEASTSGGLGSGDLFDIKGLEERSGDSDGSGASNLLSIRGLILSRGRDVSRDRDVSKGSEYSAEFSVDGKKSRLSSIRQPPAENRNAHEHRDRSAASPATLDMTGSVQKDEASLSGRDETSFSDAGKGTGAPATDLEGLGLDCVRVAGAGPPGLTQRVLTSHTLSVDGKPRHTHQLPPSGAGSAVLLDLSGGVEEEMAVHRLELTRDDLKKFCTRSEDSVSKLLSTKPPTSGALVLAMLVEPSQLEETAQCHTVNKEIGCHRSTSTTKNRPMVLLFACAVEMATFMGVGVPCGAAVVWSERGLVTFTQREKWCYTGWEKAWTDAVDGTGPFHMFDLPLDDNHMVGPPAPAPRLDPPHALEQEESLEKHGVYSSEAIHTQMHMFEGPADSPPPPDAAPPPTADGMPFLNAIWSCLLREIPSRAADFSMREAASRNAPPLPVPPPACPPPESHVSSGTSAQQRDNTRLMPIAQMQRSSTMDTAATSIDHEMRPAGLEEAPQASMATGFNGRGDPLPKPPRGCCRAEVFLKPHESWTFAGGKKDTSFVVPKTGKPLAPKMEPQVNVTFDGSKKVDAEVKVSFVLPFVKDRTLPSETWRGKLVHTELSAKFGAAKSGELENENVMRVGNLRYPDTQVDKQTSADSRTRTARGEIGASALSMASLNLSAERSRTFGQTSETGLPAFEGMQFSKHHDRHSISMVCEKGSDNPHQGTVDASMGSSFEIIRGSAGLVAYNLECSRRVVQRPHSRQEREVFGTQEASYRLLVNHSFKPCSENEVLPYYMTETKHEFKGAITMVKINRLEVGVEKQESKSGSKWGWLGGGKRRQDVATQ